MEKIVSCISVLADSNREDWRKGKKVYTCSGLAQTDDDDDFNIVSSKHKKAEMRRFKEVMNNDDEFLH